MERVAEIHPWGPAWIIPGYNCTICKQDIIQEPCIRITDNYNEKRYVSIFVCFCCTQSCEEVLDFFSGKKI